MDTLISSTKQVYLKISFTSIYTQDNSDPMNDDDSPDFVKTYSLITIKVT